jgi:hypothetical protein
MIKRIIIIKRKNINKKFKRIIKKKRNFRIIKNLLFNKKKKNKNKR